MLTIYYPKTIPNTLQNRMGERIGKWKTSYRKNIENILAFVLIMKTKQKLNSVGK